MVFKALQIFDFVSVFVISGFLHYSQEIFRLLEASPGRPFAVAQLHLPSAFLDVLLPLPNSLFPVSMFKDMEKIQSAISSRLETLGKESATSDHAVQTYLLMDEKCRYINMFAKRIMHRFTITNSDSSSFSFRMPWVQKTNTSLVESSCCHLQPSSERAKRFLTWLTCVEMISNM